MKHKTFFGYANSSTWVDVLYFCFLKWNNFLHSKESQNDHVTNSHLTKLLARVGPLLDNVIPTKIKNVKSLLTAGRLSLFRTSSGWCSIFFNICNFCAQPGEGQILFGGTVEHQETCYLPGDLKETSQARSRTFKTKVMNTRKVFGTSQVGNAANAEK